MWMMWMWIQLLDGEVVLVRWWMLDVELLEVYNNYNK